MNFPDFIAMVVSQCEFLYGHMGYCLVIIDMVSLWLV